jgi:LacI family transcriptional regulator
VKRSPRSATLKDVAQTAGVSITTVSRILNNRDSGVPIRDETRQRILEAARSLGYRPNLAARGLRGGRSSLIGVIARDISDPFHIQILRGINEAARANTYRLFLGHLDHRPEAAVAYSSMFEHSHADGIIVIGDVMGGEEALEVLTSHHRYVVGVTDRTSARGQMPGVHADSAAGAELALNHLWSLGHRAIACVSDDRTSDGRLRTKIYRDYLTNRGGAHNVQAFVTDQEPEPSLVLGEQLFKAFDDFGATAVFATSDAIAIGLVQAAHRAGVAIPGQLSIIGYDDIDLAKFIVPPLTTITQHGVEMGRSAAELLIQMIDKDLDRGEVDDVVLTPALIERESTAPVARVPSNGRRSPPEG